MFRRAMTIGLLATVAFGNGASAQLSCAQQAQSVLLGQFSDNAPSGSITPSAVRNVICSSQLLLSAGGASAAQTLFGSPTIIIAASLGSLTISNGKVELSRNGGSTWFVVSLTGGTVPVMAQDQVKISWFGASPPAVTFFPSGNS